jgi:hypothetical protein
MPSSRAPRPVRQEKDHEKFLVWVDYVSRSNPLVWSEVPSLQADRLYAILGVSDRIQSRCLTERKQEYWSILDQDSIYNQFIAGSVDYFSSREDCPPWDESKLGYASVADAIQACLGYLGRLLEIVRRV